MKSKVLLLIPARYQSSRFPGKPLADLAGKSLIQRVWEKAKELTKNSNHFVEAAVVTDDKRIEEHLQSLQANVVRVDDEVISGTERIALAMERFFSSNDYDLVLNVQGDEPLIAVETLEALINFHLESDWDIATLYHRQAMQGQELADWSNPNRVKIALNPDNGHCLYFSRAAIPASAHFWDLHVGVYCYRPKALLRFISLPPSYLEKTERLEQLRALEGGLTIGALKTDNFLMGVDTPEDLVKVKGVISGKINK